MQPTKSITFRLSGETFLIACGVLLILASCGGGGGGGGAAAASGPACVDNSGAAVVTYNGLMTPAAINLGNANIIFSAVWSGGSTKGQFVIGKPAAAPMPPSGGIPSVVKLVGNSLRSDMQRSKAATSPARSGNDVNEVHQGSVSGTLTITGSIDENTGTGCLCMVYVNFNNGEGYIRDGTIIATIDKYDLQYGVITDYTMSFQHWLFRSAASDITLTGSVRLQTYIPSESINWYTHVLTATWDGLDNNTGGMFRVENFVVTDNAAINPTTSPNTETMEGRVYLSQYGYVDCTTMHPLVYSNAFQANPDSGGPVVLIGASGSQESVTPVSSSAVEIRVSGYKNTYAWSDLAGARIKDDPPDVNAGSDQSVGVGDVVTLSGTASDQNGDSLTYTWQLSTPWGSTAALSDIYAAKPTFIADIPGIYSAAFSATDGDGYDAYDQVLVSADYTAYADAGPAQYKATGPGAVITLDGSSSVDTAGRPMTYAWNFTRKPFGSTAVLSDPSSTYPTFTADVEGKYEVSLQTFFNGYVNSEPAYVVVTVINDRPITEMTFTVYDAEYSKPLDRIIAVCGFMDNRLHIYDPETGQDDTVQLVGQSFNVSVSPDGLYAAVGQPWAVTYVDLVSKTVVTRLLVSSDVKDVVLAGNGYLYPFTVSGNFQGVEIATGNATSSAGLFPNPGIKAKLHPSGNYLYASPQGYGIQKFDILSGTPVYLYGSFGPGRIYTGGGDLWMLEDGTGFITQGGSIFTASTGTIPDLVPPKASLTTMLGIWGLATAIDSSAAASIAAIPAVQGYPTFIDDTEVFLYNDQTYGLQNMIALPYFSAGGNVYPGHGKFVFYNSSGTEMYVIMQADPAAGLTNKYGMVKY